MADLYKFLRLFLPTYFGYPILIVFCGGLCICSIIWLPIPMIIFGCLLAVYITGVIVCKLLQKNIGKWLAQAPGGNKHPKPSMPFEGKALPSKVRCRSSDGHFSTVQFPDQYEAAFYVKAVLKEDGDTRYLLSKQKATPFGRGFRYEWVAVCGNLPAI